MTPEISKVPGAEAVSASSQARRMPDMRATLDKLGPVLGLLFVFGLFAVLQRDTFLTVDNVQLMLLQTTIVAIAALGMTMIIVSGGIDLSVGSSIALSSVAVALLLAKELNPLVAIGGGIAISTLCGLAIGLLITRLNLSPFIVTLGMWGALRGAAKGLADSRTVQAPDTWVNDLMVSLSSTQKWMIFPASVWLMLLLSVLVAAMLRYTRFGRHIFAIGSNEQTARLCGVSVERTKVLIYMLASAFVGLAGVLQFSQLTLGDPTAANGKELDVIAAVVIGGASLSGGKGSIFGTLIGALIMTMVANGCTKVGVDNWVQEIVTGAIIVAAVALDRFRNSSTA